MRKKKARARLLVAYTASRREEFKPLRKYADIYWLDDMDEEEQARVLPLVDCIYSHGWPKDLDGQKISQMRNLRFFQTGNAGVNGIRFDLLDERVVVCSNAGSYSQEVAEFAIGLMFAAGKRIVKFDRQIRDGVYLRQRLDELGRQIATVDGKTLGILGYGGIGRSTARMGRALGMKVLAFGRHREDEGVKLLTGRAGLASLLRRSDVVVIALPLTNATKGLIGADELSLMRGDAMLVNVARGEIVQKGPLYEHLATNSGFVYATDVWWPDEGGVESFSPDLPFLELENFIGTPHASGPGAIVSGSVGKGVVENFTRYFQGRPLRNVVDRSEYAWSDERHQ